jgi:hypothetical protein
MSHENEFPETRWSRLRADGEIQYPELGLVGEHHGWSHGYSENGAQKPEMIKTLSKVDRLTCEQLATFLKRLKDAPEGEAMRGFLRPT